MISRNPQTISTAISSRIETELRKAIYVDESGLFFRSVSAEITKLLKVDAYEGYIANSYLHHLSGNIDVVNDNFNKASKIGNKQFIAIQKSCALSNLGYFSESKKLFENFADPEYGDFSRIVELGYATFSFESLNKWFEKAKRMKVDISLLDSTTCVRAKNILAAANVSEDKIAEMADISGEILREQRIFTVGPTEFVIEDDAFYEPCIYVTFRVDTTHEVAADLYDEFITRLITNVVAIPNVIHFAFRAAA